MLLKIKFSEKVFLLNLMDFSVCVCSEHQVQLSGILASAAGRGERFWVRQETTGSRLLAKVCDLYVCTYVRMYLYEVKMSGVCSVVW